MRRAVYCSRGKAAECTISLTDSKLSSLPALVYYDALVSTHAQMARESGGVAELVFFPING